ncbi:melanophilin isoform X2 [Zootoca vivipara]|uniref:melanophilin isoform X2 n=1 Tax=Zootoca vivipara TaxID=8524 RepID=UPI00159231DB|nr:melanophilin isoform X2 [Zootoca vivipara]
MTPHAPFLAKLPTGVLCFLKMGRRKLDLSKLTDEEAEHVWEVVQRDFDLRKKEEERLEKLKGKIEKESTKRELLSSQSHLNETHCIHCLQPFKFLVNSKRKCLDCHLHTCKNCSRYNKKEEGWVCDPCHLSRIVKTGSVEWYYEHVKSRFKRFGSAKVMRLLYGRMTHGQKMNPALLGLHDRVYSLPDINSDCRFHSGNEDSEEGEAEDAIDGGEAECFARMRKTKRLLSVHPFDFEMDSEYSAQSRRQSVQLSPGNEGLQSFAGFPGAKEDPSQRESMIAEADLAATFHHLLQEQGQHLPAPEQEFSTEVRLTVNSQSKNLERIPKAGRPWNEQHPSQYSADLDTSEEDMEGAQKTLVYQPHHTKRRSRASSQENINPSGNQILELNKRMSAVERMLNRLEEKILVHPDEPPAPESPTDPSIEEKELKRKLEELASNIRDKAVSSDEEEEEEKEGRMKQEGCIPEISSSSDDLPTDGKKVFVSAGKASGLEKRPRDRGHGVCHSTTTDSELSELEDKVAFAVAQVQQTESEVSDIESRIAALSAAGLTVKPVEKSKKKSSTQVFILQPPRNSYSSLEDQSADTPVAASAPGDFKVMSMPHVLRRKFNTSLETANNAESFARNSDYRGSLTQRNPNGRNRKADHIFAKPVMTHRS